MSHDYQKREASAVKALKDAIPASLKKNLVASSKGMFAELYENDKVFPGWYMATAVDGVGTKLLIAEAMGVFDTIGIDLVAMSANDLACFGKTAPFMFLNYLACQSKIQEKKITGDIMKGIVQGLKQCDASDILKINVNIGKGETASVDEMISGLKPGYGYDVGGCLIGFVKKEKMDFELKPGQKVLALKSSGPHSNGYTDLRLFLLNGDFETRAEFRKRYKGVFNIKDKIPGTTQTIGQALLEPTIIYTRVMAAIASKYDVVGVNNTGYGLKNLNRVPGHAEIVINNPLKPQPIFYLMQKESGFSEEKMYRTFNMGMGFFIICEEKDTKDILKICKEHNQEADIVGEVRKGKKQTVLKEIIYEGY